MLRLASFAGAIADDDNDGDDAIVPEADVDIVVVVVVRCSDSELDEFPTLWLLVR